MRNQMITAAAVMERLCDIRAENSTPRDFEIVQWMDFTGAAAVRRFCVDVAVTIDMVWQVDLTAEARDIMVWDREFIPAMIDTVRFAPARLDVMWSRSVMRIAAAKMAEKISQEGGLRHPAPALDLTPDEVDIIKKIRSLNKALDLPV